MNTVDSRYGLRVSIIIFFIATMLMISVLSAQGSWLQKGRNLLGRESAPAATGLSDQQITSGLKEALRVGSENVVGKLGAFDGFNTDPNVRIPLPSSLERVRTALRSVGMSPMLDDLELKLNRAAEVATPKARQLFLQSIEKMTLEDVMGIYNGPEDAATRYFQGKMTTPLAVEMHPVVAESLAEVGAVQVYDNVMSRYRALPMVPAVDADLTKYVVDKGIEGVFFYLAQEEAAIRQNPAKRTTELLRQVFGAK